MKTSILTLGPNTTWAALAINTQSIGDDLVELPISLPVGYILCEPFLNVDENWERVLGEWAIAELRRAPLFVVATTPTTTKTGRHDRENRQNEVRAEKFSLALGLTGFLTWSERPVIISGAQLSNGGLEPRAMHHYERYYRATGYDWQAPTRAMFEEAGQLAEVLLDIQPGDHYQRLKRGLDQFRFGLQQRFAADRLHHFVRAMEALIKPPIGKTKKCFKSRTELFVGPSHHPLIDLIYETRSSVEHMHDPLNGLTESDGRTRIGHLLFLTVLAEAIARHSLTQVLSTPRLRSYYRNDDDVDRLWTLPREEQTRLWGPVLSIAAVEAGVSDEYLESDLDD